MISSTTRILFMRFNPRTREGCDWMKILSAVCAAVFQSTHPRGVRPVYIIPAILIVSFNPRTREGCDCHVSGMGVKRYLFQSTHPRGVRLCDLKTKVFRYLELGVSRISACDLKDNTSVCPTIRRRFRYCAIANPPGIFQSLPVRARSLVSLPGHNRLWHLHVQLSASNWFPNNNTLNYPGSCQ